MHELPGILLIIVKFLAEDGSNTLAGINLVAIWFWRYHNFIATELAKVNPCWDDDKLFETARDINIAISLQIYYYELLPIFLGKIFLVTFEQLVEIKVLKQYLDENINS